MHLLLLVALLTLVAGHVHYNKYPSAGDDFDEGEGVSSTADQGNYRPPERDQYDTSRLKQSLQGVGPVSRSPWLMSLVRGISQNLVHGTPTMNLKLSGQVNITHTVKKMGMFRPPVDNHGGPRWMHRRMGGPLAKVIWFHYMMSIDKKLDDLLDARKDKLHTRYNDYNDDDDFEDDDDDEDEDDSDDEEDTLGDEEDSPNGERTKPSSSSCPFWITKQFLKLCKCSVINGKMQSVLGYPIQPLHGDPMEVFNNTPGLKELMSGNIHGFMREIKESGPNGFRKLFFAGMITSMCRQAKSFIGSMGQLEAAVMTQPVAAVQSRDTSQGSYVYGSRGSASNTF